MQQYKDEYSKQYSCIVKSSKSDEHTFCTIHFCVCMYFLYDCILHACVVL